MKVPVTTETKLKSINRTYLRSDGEVVGARRDLALSVVGFGIVFLIMFAVAVAAATV